MPGYAYDRLSVVDNSFLAIEDPNAHQHVGAVMLFDVGPLGNDAGGVDIERVRTYVDARLHLMPRYRQRLTRVPLGTRLVWVDDDHFNIHYHVRHTSLPRPGDERQLKRLAARIISQQLDRAKPLWEMWIVEGLAEDRFALVVKSHHSMIDGISGADLMAVLLSPMPDTAVPECPMWIPRPAPSRFALLRDEWMRRASERLETNFGKLVKKKTNAFILIQIVKLECLKVADENIPRKFVLFESGKIVECLCFRSLKILSGTLLFNQENTFPKQVEKSASLTEQPNRLFETRYAPACHAKDFKELVVERLALAPLVMSVLPFFGEASCADFDFVPTEVHCSAL